MGATPTTESYFDSSQDRLQKAAEKLASEFTRSVQRAATRAEAEDLIHEIVASAWALHIEPISNLEMSRVASYLHQRNSLPPRCRGCGQNAVFDGACEGCGYELEGRE